MLSLLKYIFRLTKDEHMNSVHYPKLLKRRGVRLKLTLKCTSKYTHTCTHTHLLFKIVYSNSNCSYFIFWTLNEPLINRLLLHYPSDRKALPISYYLVLPDTMLYILFICSGLSLTCEIKSKALTRPSFLSTERTYHTMYSLLFKMVSGYAVHSSLELFLPPEQDYRYVPTYLTGMNSKNKNQR